MKRKILIGIGIVSLILWITNPSISSYKNHIQFNYRQVGASERTSYWLLFSIYETKFYSPSVEEDFFVTGITYLGIAGNFFKLQKWGYDRTPYYSPKTKKYYKSEKDLP